MMDRKQHEEDLKKRQREHLDNVFNNKDNWRPCMHDQCQNCHGTGIDSFGKPCVHAISCPCPKCSPTF